MRGWVAWEEARLQGSRYIWSSSDGKRPPHNTLYQPWDIQSIVEASLGLTMHLISVLHAAIVPVMTLEGQNNAPWKSRPVTYMTRCNNRGFICTQFQLSLFTTI